MADAESGYEIIECIGIGPVASVYKARQRGLDRPVALKVLHKGPTADDDRLRRRFLAEAKLAAAVDHPNVVRVFSYGLAGEEALPFVVMELLTGHSLLHELETQGPMAPERALALLGPCLDGLALCHARGIVHKDLKPANLFLTDPGGPDEALLLVDFGMAHMKAAGVTRLTLPADILETAHYVPPEYLREQAVSPAMDVYQMGLTLVEMLSGSPVVRDKHPWSCIAMHLLGDLRVPELLMHSPIGGVIARALAHDPTKRIEDGAALGEALEEIDPATVPALPPRSKQISIARLIGGPQASEFPDALLEAIEDAQATPTQLDPRVIHPTTLEWYAPNPSRGPHRLEPTVLQRGAVFGTDDAKTTVFRRIDAGALLQASRNDTPPPSDPDAPPPGFVAVVPPNSVPSVPARPRTARPGPSWTAFAAVALALALALIAIVVLAIALWR